MKLKTALLASTSLLAMTSHAYALEAIGSIVISAMLSVGAGSMLPLASAAAIGMSAVSTALTVASLAMNFIGGRAPKSNPQDVKNTTKGTEGPGRHAFGRVLLGGEVGFGNTARYEIYRLLLHCFGKIVAVEEWFYDGRSITVEDNGDVSSPPWATPGGSNLNLQWKPGDGNETAWAELVSNFTAWTPNHRVRGIGQTLLRAINPGTGDKRFARLFQGGIKAVGVQARVLEPYDPRTGLNAWTMNGVLICLHYFRRLPGKRDDLIDFDAIGEIATQAEALVPTLDGFAPRCQLSGGWKGPLTTDVVLDMLESAGLEVRTTAEGKYTFGWLDDDPESEMTYTISHNLETYPQAGPETVQRPNLCRLRYFCPQRNFEVAEIDLTNAPWARVQSEIDKHGEQEMAIELVFCPDPSQAQRIARRLFHMARADFGVVIQNMAGISTRGKKTITLEVPDIGENGDSAFIKVRKGTARFNDGEGRAEIPFQIIPDILKAPWNPSTMEVVPPPAIPDQQYESDLPKPAMPTEAVQVIYPDSGREVRILFTGVEGGTIAEATRRTYSAGNPQPWASMTEVVHSSSGFPAIVTTWFAYAAADYNDLPADFRVRFFNSEEEGSYWSDTLEMRPLTVDNTPCAAPTIEFHDQSGGGEGQPAVGARIEVTVSELWAAYIVVNTDAPANVRPATPVTHQFPYVEPGVFDQTISYTVTVYTSDGTPGTPFNGSYVVPGTGS